MAVRWVGPTAGATPVEEIVDFTRGIIEATSDLVCAFKPQSAFFEAHGRAGWDALKATIEAVPDDVPVILDVKRGDIASTAEAYATACFRRAGCGRGDAQSLPGRRRGCAVPGAGREGRVHSLPDIEPGGRGPAEPGGRGRAAVLAGGVAGAGVGRRVSERGVGGGATYPAELAAVRARCPAMPILLPGIGAQGGDLEASVAAGVDASGGGLLVSASRLVIYASVGVDFASAARAEAERLREAITPRSVQRRRLALQRRLHTDLGRQGRAVLRCRSWSSALAMCWSCARRTPAAARAGRWCGLGRTLGWSAVGARTG